MNDRNGDTFQDFLPAILEWLKMLFLGRDQAAGYFRLGLSLILFSMYWVFVVIVTGFPGEVPISLLRSFPPFTYPLLNVASTFFNPEVILHLLPLLGMLFFGLFLGSLYLTDLYELDSFWTGFQYLVSSMFGLNYPRLVINQGDVALLDPYNPIRSIGGPGYIRVNLGFAAVFENQVGVPHVYGYNPEQKGPTTKSDSSPNSRSIFRLSGFERIRDVVDLRDRIGTVDEIRSFTRDGIEVYAREAQMVFRVFGGDQERNLDNPYPYDEQAVRRLVYGQPVDDNGSPGWENLLTNLVRNEIQDFVSGYTLEEFLALQPYHTAPETGASTVQEEIAPGPSEIFHIPRRQLTNRFYTPELKSRLESMGLEMDWVGVGTWEIRDPVLDGDIHAFGPGQTLIKTWRDHQRAQLYRSTIYLDRQRVESFQDRTSTVLEGFPQIWRQTKLGEEYRCYELITKVRDQIKLISEELLLDPSYTLPEKSKLVIKHLDRLVQPKKFGA